jgi:hypothetical protein
MKTRNTLYTIMLIAYSLSMAHSVIPHHHHQSAEEANHSHDHSGKDYHHGHKHHHDDHDDSSKEDGHLFFLTHDFNSDFLSHAFHSDNVIKHKKQKAADTEMKHVSSPSFAEHLIFHPPQDEVSLSSFIFTAVSLRAPPIA